MALYKDPKQAILDAMSAQNGVSLVANQYTFGVPAELSPAEGLLNTTIEVTAVYPNSPYDGSVTVKYHRLPLSDLNVLIPLTIKVNGVTTIADLIPVLNAAHGFNFTSDDLEDGNLDLQDGQGTATLVAKSTSLGWVGSVVLNIAPGDIDIKTYVSVTSLPGLLYPAQDNSKPFGLMYSYWRDFSAQYDAISVIPTGTDGLAALKDVLAAITGDNWITDAIGRYSLLGATVAYNGSINGSPDYNSNYESVLVVQLHPTNCQGLSGKLVCHYTQPNFNA
jgi:hypothetical protein